ncbi:MAG: hypothetical protein H6Q44_1681 [Deltaproteobacteria bacterium]|jgi:hypothetical protein|nr:hypothetical protein [Deltaproteobacteria bacterium]
MRSYEQVYSLFWVFLSIGICVESIRLQIWDASSGPVAGFIPFLAGLLIGICGLLMLISGWSRKTGKEKREQFWPEGKATRRIGFVLAGLCAMAFFMPILGFLITSVLMTAFMLRIIEPQKWTAVILTSLSCCLLVYWLFNRFLEVSLPKGFLGI